MPPLLRLALPLLLLTPCPAGAQGIASRATDGYPRQDAVDVLHYDIALELPPRAGPIAARAGVLVERRSAELESLRLDFGPLAVDSVRVDGAPASWMHGDGALMVTLPAATPGVRHLIEVWYGGEPADGLVQRENLHGEPGVFADNWPDRARAWFPAVDHPSDKATVAFAVTAPAAWRVVANGVLLERRELGGGRALTRWAESSPVPTYTMVIGAGPFAVADAGSAAGVPLTHWTFPQDSVPGAAGFGRSGEILAFYDSLFGPYPYDKLAHVQSATRYGGMENASAIFYSERRVGEPLAVGVAAPGAAREDMTALVAHETVHQWFGDGVTEHDWHHLWLSEGFATYFAAVFFEFHGSSSGGGAPELARRLRAMREQVLAWDGAAGLAIVDTTLAVGGDYGELLHTGNYQKGAWVLHMLRREVGDEAFFEGVRRFYLALRGGNAWSADFERFVEEASGRELDAFFAQWLGRPGHPVLRVDTEPAAGGATRVVVRQVQAGEPWRIAVELAIEGAGGVRRERVEMTGREAAVDVSGAIGRVVPDPDAWLLWSPGGP